MPTNIPCCYLPQRDTISAWHCHPARHKPAKRQITESVLLCFYSRTMWTRVIRLKPDKRIESYVRLRVRPFRRSCVECRQAYCALWSEEDVLAGSCRSNCTVNSTLCYYKQSTHFSSHTVCSSSTEDCEWYSGCLRCTNYNLLSMGRYAA